MTATFTLLGGRLIMEDTPPRPSEDALWLAASLTPAAGSRVLDAFAGSGVVGLALLARCPQLEVTAVEIDAVLAAQAGRNAAMNARPLVAVCGDVLEHHPVRRYDVALLNPPFHATRRGHATRDQRKALAHGLPPGQLVKWLGHMAEITSGTLAMIIHSACEDDILAFATRHGCAVQVLPLVSREGAPAKRLIVHVCPAAGFSLRRLPPLPVYAENLRRQVLEQAHALPCAMG